MAGNNAWDRTILNALERPLSSDINQALSQVDRSLRDLIYSAWNEGAGFLNSAFAPSGTATPLQLRLSAGMGFILDAAANTIDGVPGLDDRSPIKPVLLTADQTLITTTPPGGGLERYDLVEIRTNRRRTNSSSRDVLDPVTGVFNATLLLKTLAFDVDGDVGVVASPAASTAAISIKTGTPAGTGTAVVPTGTAGYTPVAVLYVPNGTTTLGGKIRDLRANVRMGIGGAHPVTAGFPLTIGTPDVVAGVDVAQGWPNNGMRFGILPGSPGPNSPARLFMFCGDPGVRPAAAQLRVRKVSGAGTNNLHPLVTAEGGGTLSALDATALQAVPNLLSVMAGQPYYSWTVQAQAISGAVSGGDVLHFLLTVMF